MAKWSINIPEHEVQLCLVSFQLLTCQVLPRRIRLYFQMNYKMHVNHHYIKVVKGCSITFS